MNPFDTLSALAEIAIALAGFSSVIVVFRSEGAAGTWRSEDAFRSTFGAGLIFYRLVTSPIEGAR